MWHTMCCWTSESYNTNINLNNKNEKLKLRLLFWFLEKYLKYFTPLFHSALPEMYTWVNITLKEESNSGIVQFWILPILKELRGNYPLCISRVQVYIREIKYSWRGARLFVLAGWCTFAFLSLYSLAL